MKKLYLYIRLSDADDDLKFKTESESIANQRTLLYRFIRARREFDGYEVVEFIDDGYSGTNGNRPSFERMIESLKNGEANVVICKDFSRFFRDYVEIGDYLERIFPFLGVRFIAVNDGYDSDDYKGSTAGMEVVMKYIVYSYYSRDLSQKIKTVMSTRKSKGEFVASQAPYGYMKDPDVKRKIIPNPDTAPVVRKIFDLALEGKTPAEIAVVLNDYKLETPSAYYMRMNPDSKKFRTSSKEACWTVSNVREILKRREYTGVMVMNQRHWKGLDNPRTVWTDESEWQIIPDCHEAIVSESEYEEAQKVFRKIRKGYDRSPDQYLLRSLVHCGACGRTMQRQKHSPVVYYTCLKSVSNRETACPVGERFIEADLERIVKNDLLEKLRLLVDADDRLYAAAAASEGTEENIRFRLEQIEKRMKQISLKRTGAYERYADGYLDRELYLAERDKLYAEADTLTEEKDKLEKELLSLTRSKNKDMEDAVNKVQDVLSASELTNEMLLFFIDRVNVYSGMRVEIIYRFSDEIARAIEDMKNG
ncbi:recombinase family protein [Dysosmobacter sp. HCP28S3_G4]|uniref:recombinase family protein n=1 Tax=Dysosmobacter sp. HCP28S3_G4 TaxID=3438938 RepID=UPI003F8A34AB